MRTQGKRFLSSSAERAWQRLNHFRQPAGPPQSLEGQVAWVVGGAGVIGTGLVRGLLRAGATVICNSRHRPRLTALIKELDNPERLLTLHGSMLPDGAEATVEAALEMSSGQLDHVVTHSAVRWWLHDGHDVDETATVAMGSGHSVAAGGLLDLTTDEFARQAMQLPRMQFETARLLVPKLARVPLASYTFITGGAGEGCRSSIGHLNTQAVWGLAAALRHEHRTSSLKMTEVRVSLEFNRKLEDRLANPRDIPLSHDIGSISAGLAASRHSGSSLHLINSQDDIPLLKSSFPVVERPYPIYFSPADIL